MVVYTAVFGGYDTVRAPEHPGNARWVCITDGDVAPKPWHTVSLAPWVWGDQRRRARGYKVRSHRYFTDSVVVWLDGNVTLRVPPEELLHYIEDADIAAVKHFREDHYAEAEKCIELGKGSPGRIAEQVAVYQEAGCPPCPVTANFLMVRRQTPAVARLNSMWWRQIRLYSVRDQISLPYCLWHLGMPIALIPGTHAQGPDFVRHSHG